MQQASGTFNGASGTVGLAVAAESTSTLILCAAQFGSGASRPVLQPPAGFVLASPETATTSASTTPFLFAADAADVADSTNITLAFASGSGERVVWHLFEYPDLETAANVAGIPNPFDDTGTVTSRSTGNTTGATSAYDVTVFAMFPARGTDTTVPDWSSPTNGFDIIAEHSGVDAVASAFAVATKWSGSLGVQECTANVSPASNSRAVIVALASKTAKYAPRVDVMFGGEMGPVATAALTATSSANNAGPGLFDAVGGSPVIDAVHPRSGTYGLKLTATAGPCWVAWSNPTSPAIGALNRYAPTSSWQAIARLDHYFEDLPTTDLPLGSIEVGGTSVGMFWFRVASSKIAMKIGSAADVLSDAAISPDVHFTIDYRYDPTVTNHTCDWAVDYNSLDGTGPVTQTQAVGSGTSAGTITQLVTGWKDNRTATMWVDDMVVSKVAAAWPLGDQRIVGLKPDPAGTPSVQGTASNFRTFTNNGTYATFDGAAARNALDEIPPVAGSTADGVTQITAAVGDYVRVPMETYSGGERTPEAVRWWVCPWAASATSAMIGFGAYDGTTELLIISDDHGQDDSTLMFITRMMGRATGGSTHYALSKAKLDAFEIRIGYSGDATPDTGAVAVGAELLLTPTVTYRTFTEGDGEFTVDVRQDPRSGTPRSYLVTASGGPTRKAYLHVTQDGSETVYPVDGDTAWEHVTNAYDISQVTAAGMHTDPAP